jgi:nucleoside-diphosphate-sugar epimerase
VVTLRPPFIYGPENPFYREAFFWDRLREGRPVILPGDGHRLMQFVYIKDLVRASLRAMEAPDAVGEAFNVANERPVTQAEFIQAMAATAGKKPNIVRVPRERIAEAGGDPMGQPAYFGVYLDVPPITEVVVKAKRILGFQPTPFEVGLKETYRWYLRNAKKSKIDYTFEDRLIEMATVAPAAD